MSQLHHRQKQDTYATNLLVSLLMRFPEIMSIRFDKPQEQILFNFLLAGRPTKEELAGFKALLKESFAAYADLSSEKLQFKVALQSAGKLSILGIKASTETLSLEGISLLCGLVCRAFSRKIVRDAETLDAFYDEEMLRQEEIIAYLLNHGVATNKENLLAFRDAGKVLVYNK